MFTGKGTCTLYIRLMTQKLSEQAHDQRDTDGKYTHRKILATFDQLKNQKKKFRRSHSHTTQRSSREGVKQAAFMHCYWNHYSLHFF